MKLLRDFFRLRSAGRFLLSGRHEAVRRSWTITVPQPLNKPAEAVVIDMRWHADKTTRGRPVAHWQEEHAASQAHCHLQLVSSH
ncbi:MAG: hypothetical protein WA777_07870 [Rhodanobacter sp.]